MVFLLWLFEVMAEIYWVAVSLCAKTTSWYSKPFLYREHLSYFWYNVWSSWTRNHMLNVILWDLQWWTKPGTTMDFKNPKTHVKSVFCEINNWWTIPGTTWTMQISRIYIPFPFEGLFVECCTYAVSIYRWIYMLSIIVLYKLCLPLIPGRLYRVELSWWLGRVLVWHFCDINWHFVCIVLYCLLFSTHLF